MKNYGNNLTYEFCYNEAKKFKTLKEFKNGSKSSYAKSLKNNWLADFSWLKRVKTIKWTEESTYLEAKKYKSRSEFQKGCLGAYKKSKKMGWINSYTWFKTPVISPNLDELNKTIWCVYSYEFKNLNFVYVGLTKEIHRRDNEHRRTKKDSLYIFSINNNVVIPEPNILMQGLTSIEAQDFENYYIIKYKEKNWNLINKGKTGRGISSLGGFYRKWNKETCFNLAKTCRTISEFKKKSSRAYEVSRKNHWLEEYTWFMPGKTFYSKRVGKYSLTGELLSEYESISEAARSLEKSYSVDRAITNVCKGKKEHAFGYIWRFLE